MIVILLIQDSLTFFYESNMFKTENQPTVD